jgi:hypothetical protein
MHSPLLALLHPDTMKGRQLNWRPFFCLLDALDNQIIETVLIHIAQEDVIVGGAVKYQVHSALGEEVLPGAREHATETSDFHNLLKVRSEHDTVDLNRVNRVNDTLSALFLGA